MGTLLIYLATFIILYTITKHIFHKLQNFPPKPKLPSLPLIGHLYLLKRPLHKHLAALSKNNNTSLLSLDFGSRPVLFVSSPSLAEECLSKNDIVFANRPKLVMGKYLGQNFTTMVWASYGDHWRNLRRISSLELLSTHRLQEMTTIRDQEVKDLIRRLKDKERNKEAADLRMLFFELTLNIVMRMVAGKKYYGDKVAEESDQARRFKEMTAETARIAGHLFLSDFVPVLRWVDGGKEEKLMELQRKREKFMQELIDEHRRKKMEGGDHEKTMIGGVLLPLQEQEPNYYTDDIIIGLVSNVLIGATHTTSNTLEWAFTLLLNHPNILKKAQSEIDNLVGPHNLINESHTPQLPYLTSIIKETLRMHPPVPLSLPHASSEECIVGGYRVPRGTILFVNQWAIHNDPQTWNDPENFRPERFLERQGNVEGDQGLGLGYLPFSWGRRRCPGEGLALRVMALTVGSMIQCFEWDTVGKDLLDMTEGNDFSATKLQPLKAICRSRTSVVDLI